MIYAHHYTSLVGFGLACAPVRCAHPSFWAHFHAKQGAARLPAAHRSLAASYSVLKNYNELFPITKCFPLGDHRGFEILYNVPQPFAPF